MACRVGRALWRTVPRVPPPGPGETPVPILDFAAAARAAGFLERLERKPWVMLGDTREGLEHIFGLQTDELLVAMRRWAELCFGKPAAVGMAHQSGNVYLASELDMGTRTMTAAEALLGNIYTHGEIGIDAIASEEPPTGAAVDLLKELHTFKRIRWLDPQFTENLGDGTIGEAKQRELGSIIRSTKPRMLKKYPLIADLSKTDMDTFKPGNCLQHPNFKWRDLEGENMEEWKVSVAGNAAHRSYRPPGDTRPLVGCALLTTSRHLFAGYSLRSRLGTSLSPAETGLLSMAASGYGPEDVVGITWTSVDPEDVNDFREADEALLKTICPKFGTE
mmetsp:Transcript_82980/g.173734  ORF Transcript_82980/g.173734 Transcript_82980/m.173734 type:complete len:334 (-) Transcript_82980:165-1166(-)